ncbi:acyltransferase [Flavobacterium hankyongi]|uniref:acyltransferase n=2 Tax=Flavobacteriaceae TaxID=49546 RepID=UPI0031EC8156
MFLSKTVSLYKKCKKAESNFVISFMKHFAYRILYSKNFILHHKVSVKGITNIETNDRLDIGMSYIGFMHKTHRTYLNIQGKLKLNGPYSIGRGCRFDIAEKAVMSIGKGGYINVNSTFIIMHGLTIGDYCVISWDCQFLDEDFHDIDYEGKTITPNEITIGNNVWIGCGVKIYKGSVVPDGCVIAANSIVRGVFTKQNTLIAGHPAKVIKEEINWK